MGLSFFPRQVPDANTSVVSLSRNSPSGASEVASLPNWVMETAAVRLSSRLTSPRLMRSARVSCCSGDRPCSSAPADMERTRSRRASAPVLSEMIGVFPSIFIHPADFALPKAAENSDWDSNWALRDSKVTGGGPLSLSISASSGGSRTTSSSVLTDSASLTIPFEKSHCVALRTWSTLSPARPARASGDSSPPEASTERIFLSMGWSVLDKSLLLPSRVEVVPALRQKLLGVVHHRLPLLFVLR